MYNSHKTQEVPFSVEDRKIDTFHTSYNTKKVNSTDNNINLKRNLMDKSQKTQGGRRSFTKKMGLLGLSGFAPIPFSGILSFSGKDKVKCRVETLTSGPENHFFGYYGICPWNKDETHLLSLESGFHDRMPVVNETANIGMVDASTGKFEKLTQTTAWNLQQGAMMHWHPKAPNDEILYNDFHDNELASTVMNIKTGKKRYLPHAISALDHQGNNALFISYGRTGRLRKVVGYQGLSDPNPNDPHPADDGVFLMDLATGKSKLIVSIDQVYELIKDRHPELADKPMWFNHTEFNDSGDRFFFLARTWNEKNRLQTGMYTANIDGSDLREAVPYGKSVSHFDWRDDKQIMATFNLDGTGAAHVLFTDGKSDYRAVGGKPFKFDGHCSFAPDKNWFTTDRKHGNTLTQTLWIYNMEKEYGQKLADFPMKEKKYITGDTRCDLHPRWNRSGNKICVDALDPKDWTRQLHVIHLDL